MAKGGIGWSAGALIALALAVALVGGLGERGAREPGPADPPAVLAPRAVAPAQLPLAYLDPKAAFSGPPGGLPAVLLDGLAGEFWVRELAALAGREPTGFLSRLEAASSDPDWRVRTRALDGLARARSAGLLRSEPVARAAAASARAALEDPHPNVRAAAVLACLGEESFPLALWLGLAADPLAEVRLAVVRALASLEGPVEAAHLGALARLLEDQDPRVRRAALSTLGLWVLETPDPHGQVGLFALWVAQWQRLESARWEAERIHLAASLARGEADGRWYEGALEALLSLDERGPLDCARGVPISPEAAARREVRGLLSALAFAVGARGDRADFLGAWYHAERWIPERQEVFARAGRGGDLALGHAVSQGIWVLAEPHIWLRQPEGGNGLCDLARGAVLLLESDSLVRDLGLDVQAAELALELLGPERFLEAMEGPNQPRVMAARWAAMVRRAPPWPAAHARRFAGESARFSPGLLEALEASAELGDRGASEGLLVLLQAGAREEQLRAFSALARGNRDGFADGAIAQYVQSSPAPAALLGRLVGRRVPAALEPLLVHLGRGGHDGRELAVELLRGGGLSPELRAELERWWVEELSELDGAESAQRERAGRRAAQLLDALLESGEPKELVPIARVALQSATGRSVALGRRAARVLGASAAGREVLCEALLAPMDRDIRLEVAVALAGAGEGARASVALLADFPTATLEHQLRLLDAFARVDLPEVQALYAGLAEGVLPAGARADSELVHAALDLLGQRSGWEPLLAKVVRSVRDVSEQAAALAALGRSGGAIELLALQREFHGASPSEHQEGAAWPPRDEERREILRGPLLVALCQGNAYGTASSQGTAEGLPLPLDAALARAEADLLQRQARRPLPDARYEWSHDLDALGILAGRGDADFALARQSVWHRLDGRLLLEVGLVLGSKGRGPARDALEAGGEQALRLAQVALVGEGPSAASAVARARAELLKALLRRGQFEEVAPLARSLVRSVLVGEFPERVLSGALLAPSEESRGDVLARLRAIEAMAAAHVAWAQGDGEGARQALGRARAHAARCSRSAVELDQLEQAARADGRMEGP